MQRRIGCHQGQPCRGVQAVTRGSHAEANRLSPGAGAGTCHGGRSCMGWAAASGRCGPASTLGLPTPLTAAAAHA
eukprot:358346-Chlamydomonas_euryale.AAC.2